MKNRHGAKIQNHGLHHHWCAAENLYVCRKKKLKQSIQGFDSPVVFGARLRNRTQHADQKTDCAADQCADQRKLYCDQGAVQEQVSVLVQKFHDPIGKAVVSLLGSAFRRL